MNCPAAGSWLATKAALLGSRWWERPHRLLLRVTPLLLAPLLLALPLLLTPLLLLLLQTPPAHRGTTSSPWTPTE